ncbi:MAG: hypothetical protein ACLFTK_06035 [Anaerolineales bacterium]
MSNNDGLQIQAIYEGDTFSVYRIEEEGGEVGYDLNLFDSVTVHFLKEEWQAFLEVMHDLEIES